MNIFEDDHRSYARFPIWLELSGLPEELQKATRLTFAFAVFRFIVEADLAVNPSQPGVVEFTIAECSRRVGLDGKKIRRAINALRKQGLLRAFVPDTDEEAALIQIITPLPTPKSAEEVRREHSDVQFAEWPPRYSVGTQDAPETERESKARVVVDLYLNVFSMKINSLIVDQLKLISDRYDMDLIKKVFHRAKEREATSLGFILSEITKEDRFRRQPAEAAKSSTETKPPL